MLNLANDLRAIYDKTPEGERTVALYLFGITHASHLKGSRLSKIAAEAGLHHSVYWAIRKGRKLADYVEIIDNPS